MENRTQCEFFFAAEGREERVPSKEDHEVQEQLCSQVEPASASSLGSHQRCIDCEMDSRSWTRLEDTKGQTPWECTNGIPPLTEHLLGGAPAWPFFSRWNPCYPFITLIFSNHFCYMASHFCSFDHGSSPDVSSRRTGMLSASLIAVFPAHGIVPGTSRSSTNVC